jgi:spore coat polysaccharide biosynthesis protein SpsF
VRIVAIVQARMGSQRLPGKVLKPLGGVPMLWHTLKRLERVPEIHEIVLATSDLKQDDLLADFAGEERIPVFRGSEGDVLERYYLAARTFKTDAVIRITGDCPFIDPEITRKTIRSFLEEKVDYASNVLDRTFPRGTDTEVFSFHALEKAYQEGSRPEDREHVTYYMRTNPEKFKLKGIRSEKDLSYIRHCVDVEEDYLFVQALFYHLAGRNMFFTTSDIERELRRSPWLATINGNVQQKPIP